MSMERGRRDLLKGAAWMGVVAVVAGCDVRGVRVS